MTTGALSSVLEDAPRPAFAARVGPGVESALPGRPSPAAELQTAASEPLPAGVWQVQVGAFRNTQAAEAHLRTLESGVPELARLTPIHRLRGRLNQVRIAGIENEAAARALCKRIAAAGGGCFVVEPEG